MTMVMGSCMATIRRTMHEINQYVAMNSTMATCKELTSVGSQSLPSMSSYCCARGCWFKE